MKGNDGVVRNLLFRDEHYGSEKALLGFYKWNKPKGERLDGILNHDSPLVNDFRSGYQHLWLSYIPMMLETNESSHTPSKFGKGFISGFELLYKETAVDRIRIFTNAFQSEKSQEEFPKPFSGKLFKMFGNLSGARVDKRRFIWK